MMPKLSAPLPALCLLPLLLRTMAAAEGSAAEAPLGEGGAAERVPPAAFVGTHQPRFAAAAVTLLAIAVGTLFWRLAGAGARRSSAELEYWQHRRRRAVATIAELLEAAKPGSPPPAASKVFRAIFDEFEDALVTKAPLSVPEDGARINEMKDLLRRSLGLEISEAIRSDSVSRVEALELLGRQARRHVDHALCRKELQQAAAYLHARGAARRRHIWRLLEFVDRESFLWLGTGLIIKIFSQIPQPVRMLYVSATVTAAGHGEDGALHFKAAISMCFWLLVAEKLLQFAGRVTMFKGEQLFTVRLKKEVYAACLRQDMEFFDNHRSGEIQLRLDSDTKEICQKVLYFPVRFVQFMFFLLFNLITLLSSNTWLVMATLSVLPLSLFGNVVLMKRMRRFYDRIQRRAEISASKTQEVLSSIRTVRAFAREPYELLRYTRDQEYEARIMSTVNLLQGMMQPLLHAITDMSFFIGLYYGGLLIMEGKLASAEVITLVQGTQLCTGVLMDLLDTLPEIAKAGKPASRICELLERPSLIEVSAADSRGEQQSRAKSAAIASGQIDFEDVHFAYSTRRDAQVLSGLSFSAQPGELLALVGATGCGKSTVVQLLLRFYAPTSGRVLLDGRPLDNFDPHQLRSQIGVVAQEPLLFGTSIRSNLLYGAAWEASSNETVSDERLQECCCLANAWEFVSRLPEGLSTEVGEHGCQLSGGQKQRLAIARAVLKKPRVLLLDEATSALDPESEQVVQKALDEVIRASSCTTIVIAHRLATIRNATKIVAIEGGVVREEGAPGELSKRPSGLYARMLKAQGSGKLSPVNSPVHRAKPAPVNGVAEHGHHADAKSLPEVVDGAPVVVLNGTSKAAGYSTATGDGFGGDVAAVLAHKLELLEQELCRRADLAAPPQLGANGDKCNGGTNSEADKLVWKLLAEARGAAAGLLRQEENN